MIKMGITNEYILLSRDRWIDIIKKITKSDSNNGWVNSNFTYFKTSRDVWKILNCKSIINLAIAAKKDNKRNVMFNWNNPRNKSRK